MASPDIAVILAIILEIAEFYADVTQHRKAFILCTRLVVRETSLFYINELISSV
jgi:hypothetical protein